MAEERIQKIMSEQGLCSRRAAEQKLKEDETFHPLS